MRLWRGSRRRPQTSKASSLSSRPAQPSYPRSTFPLKRVLPNRAAAFSSTIKPSRRFSRPRLRPNSCSRIIRGRSKKLENSEHTLLEGRLRYRESSLAADLRWQSETEALRVLEASVADAQQRLAVYRRDQAETAMRCDAVRDSLASVRARRYAVEQVLSDRSYSTETVQKLFANGSSHAEGGSQENFRAVGLLADYAEVEPQYETAIEQFLRDEFEYVVVETFDHARAGIALLREEFGGRATFLVGLPAYLGASSL